MLHDRFADHSTEYPMEVIGGEVGLPREVIQRDRVIQMLLDIEEDL